AVLEGDLQDLRFRVVRHRLAEPQHPGFPQRTGRKEDEAEGRIHEERRRRADLPDRDIRRARTYCEPPWERLSLGGFSYLGFSSRNSQRFNFSGIAGLPES